jgi:hypothetical protein
MSNTLPAKLDRLRQIGWSLWNPIGLDDAWKADAPDEYDQYLLHVADMSNGGASEADAAKYLIRIAAEHMGLTYVDSQAAAATAYAIFTCVKSTRDGP